MERSIANVSDPELTELVNRCRDQDPDAFDELMKLFQNWIYSVNRQIVRDPDDAGDLTQETFLRAWKAFPKFDGKNGVASWLRRIAVNASIDFTRRKRAAPLDEETIEALSHTASQQDIRNSREGPEHELERSELRKALSQAMDKISPEHRAVIVLKDIEGISYREIASTLGCSIGTVMSRLFYARKNLQALLISKYPAHQ